MTNYNKTLEALDIAIDVLKSLAIANKNIPDKENKYVFAAQTLEKGYAWVDESITYLSICPKCESLLKKGVWCETCAESFERIERHRAKFIRRVTIFEKLEPTRNITTPIFERADEDDQ